MDFKRYNITKSRTENLKDGTEKTFWDKVGSLTLFTKEDGSESGIVDLVSFDKSIRLNVFPIRENEAVAKTNNVTQPEEETIRVENIPF